MNRTPLKPQNNQIQDKIIDDKDQKINIITQNTNIDSFDKNLPSRQLQEAIIWSEILGKPVCKRRKRSYYGY